MGWRGEGGSPGPTPLYLTQQRLTQWQGRWDLKGGLAPLVTLGKKDPQVPPLVANAPEMLHSST